MFRFYHGYQVKLQIQSMDSPGLVRLGRLDHDLLLPTSGGNPNYAMTPASSCSLSVPLCLSLGKATTPGACSIVRQVLQPRTLSGPLMGNLFPIRVVHADE
ncbi:hypothetical protein LIA77_05482 [Sarocladium implicatum]|nr:hypothetical protein LIA77_05482 [Sarocladium implicatum]